MSDIEQFKIQHFAGALHTAMDGLQAQLHHVMNQNLPWMPLLVQLWKEIDDVLHVLDKIEDALALEREREAFKKRSLQRDLLEEQEAMERDAYLRAFARE